MRSGGLTGYSQQFATARSFSFVLAAMWLVGFAVEGELAVIYGIVATAVNCLMIWNLLGGIIDFSLQRQRPDLAQQAESRRIAYIALYLLISLMALTMRRSEASGAIAIAMVLCMIVLLIMILTLIHRVKVEVAD